MIGSGWANNCGKELFTNGWVKCFVYVFEEGDPDGGGTSSRSHVSLSKLNAQQLAQVQREDEELIAIVTVIGQMIL